MKVRKTVLVTGSAGQLGATLLMESKNSLDIDWVFYDSGQLDITNSIQVEDVFSTNNFDYCINCAAFTNVEKAEIEPNKALEVNFTGVKNIVDAIKNKPTILIHISTDYVFDGLKPGAYNELDSPNPINAYGRSKLLGEKYIINNLEHYYIVRTSWLFSGTPPNFYTHIRSKLANNSNIDVISSQIGSPTSTMDLCHGLIQIVHNEQKNYGIFHFSNSGLTNWYIFAKEIICEIDPKKINQLVEIEEFKSLAKRPKNSKLDTSKFEKVFDYKIPDWKDALKRVIKRH